MAAIEVLDSITIDKIAAGEVVERPASVVKELVENAMDAGAKAITVEIKDGGISLIRVTDDGSGIPKDQVQKAFYRHATSKIKSAADLSQIHSLGFRGEALSSIAAVSQVELFTKPKDALLGCRYRIDGGKELECSEVGLPDGTTILVKNLFFNTPPRKKFLKSKITEGGYISELCEHLALSRPDVSFRFVSSGQDKFQTNGKGDLKEVIYRIYGKEIIKECIPFSYQSEDGSISLSGYLGKPILNRATRNFELFFVNDRFVKSNILAKALEEGYKPYLMQHKFPFAVLFLEIHPEEIDVNVHPTKMEIRFHKEPELLDFVSSAVTNGLKQMEMIPQVQLTEEKKEPEKKEKVPNFPEIFEKKREEKVQAQVQEKIPIATLFDAITIKPEPVQPIIKAKNSIIIEKPVQMSFLEEKIFTQENRPQYSIIGQVFETYWLVTYGDKLLFVDQHAAHEKVNYEKLMKQVKAGEVVSQQCNPPIICPISGKEEAVLEEYGSYLEALGFVWEDFGDHTLALRQVPLELYGHSGKNFFKAILDEISQEGVKGTPEIIQEKIASMSCKASVKGNSIMKTAEMESLLDQLLILDNPYHCPHGRPTMIVMTKQELEKKFKRIV